MSGAYQDHRVVELLFDPEHVDVQQPRIHYVQHRASLARTDANHQHEELHHEESVVLEADEDHFVGDAHGLLVLAEVFVGFEVHLVDREVELDQQRTEDVPQLLQLRRLVHPLEHPDQQLHREEARVVCVVVLDAQEVPRDHRQQQVLQTRCLNLLAVAEEAVEKDAQVVVLVAQTALEVVALLRRGRLQTLAA